jgi:hypothetical protein
MQLLTPTLAGVFGRDFGHRNSSQSFVPFPARNQHGAMSQIYQLLLHHIFLNTSRLGDRNKAGARTPKIVLVAEYPLQGGIACPVSALLAGDSP